MGTVYLVGAGPGDPGLLTLRAAELLAQADVVVHDALVGEGVMDRIPPGVERVDVGKRGGGRATSQAFIHRILVEASARARVVVRLKGGDPFIFGRGGEEALALQAAGVRFEVVPGVTAALGAAAYAGIPLTHRGMSSAVTFVTGTAGDAGSGGAGDLDGADWARLAASGGTLVVYMGMRVLPRLVERLIQGGRPGETPAAIVEWGTLPRQRVVSGSLSTITARGSEAGVGSPAILVVGEVAALGRTLGWFDGVAQGRAWTGGDLDPDVLLPPAGAGLPAAAGGA